MIGYLCSFKIMMSSDIYDNSSSSPILPSPCLPAFGVVEAVIENLVFVEYTFSTTITESKNSPQDVGKTCKSPWLMNSVEIHTSKGVYAVFNALDTNGIETKPAVGEEFRRLPLV